MSSRVLCTCCTHRTAARELFGQEVPPGPLPLRIVRNVDLKEVTLECGGSVVLRFAAVYGFRNIQTVMRQMKGGRCRYDYVEVMACPSGEIPHLFSLFLVSIAEWF